MDDMKSRRHPVSEPNVSIAHGIVIQEERNATVAIYRFNLKGSNTQVII